MKINIVSEFFGTMGLLIVVVGSGIMGESLSQGNAAIALLANALATGAGLYALIQTFGPISGAHFNPAVSLYAFLNKKISLNNLASYCVAQIIGAISGVIITHAMFGQQLLQFSTHDRSDLRFFFSEFIATSGLLLVIAMTSKWNSDKTATTVAMFITAAYWCTSSTSFANPAVTIARSFTNSFAGIQLNGVPGFVAAQVASVFVIYLTLNFDKKS